MDKSYYLFSSGRLVRKDNSLSIVKSDGVRTDFPIKSVYDIYSFGDLDFNSDVVDFLGSAGINLHFFNYYGYYTATLYPREKLVSGDLLVKQTQHYADMERRIVLAQAFVAGAADNILRNLKYYAARGKDVNNQIIEIGELKQGLESCGRVDELMGLEGNIRKVYYSAWEKIFDTKVDFVKRTKRPPDNMVNALISFLNSVFYTKTLTEIYKTQLNPSVSYLHVPSVKRFSLALDVSEVFKPLVVDRLIFRLVNRNMITEEDFVRGEDCLRMKPQALKTVMKELDDFMLTTIHHRTLNKDVSYRYLIRLELYNLIKHLIGERKYSPFRIWW